MEARVIHVPDVEDPTAPASLHSVVKGLGFRSQLSVPLLRDGQPIGVLSLLRRQPGPYSPAQIALVTTFADQAVIAIENSRLFEAEQTRTAELQARTRELTESLEQQTGTADVLKVISRSALDVQKVLDALVESAARLCDAYDATIFQVFGDRLRLVAHYGQLPTSAPVGHPCARGHWSACRHRPANHSRHRLPGRSGRISREPPACAANRLSHRARRPPSPRGGGNWGDLPSSRRSAPVHRTSDRARQYLRRSGRHRN